MKSRALLFLTAALLAGCAKPVAPAPAGPPEVLVTEAIKDNVPVFKDAIATLEGSINTQIHSQVSGYLLKQDYTEGSQVQKGDLMFDIDPKPFQANLDKAQADLQNKQAALLRSQQDLTRYAALVKQGAVSQQEYQNEVQTVQGAQANVDASQATVVAAQIELGYTKITAPITGIAGRAIPGIGDLISPSTNLTTISALDPIKAMFTVPEQFYLNHADKLAELALVPLDKRPERMELIMPDGSIYPRKGRFYYVDRQIQSSTGAITMYGLFPNPDNILRPGQYAKVRAVTDDIAGAVLIPQRAVNELQGTNQVAVVTPGNVIELRNVTLGDKVGPLCIVTSGLNAGEHVVVEGIQKCQPGLVVTPEPYVPSASSEPPKVPAVPPQP